MTLISVVCAGEALSSSLSDERMTLISVVSAGAALRQGQVWRRDREDLSGLGVGDYSWFQIDMSTVLGCLSIWYINTLDRPELVLQAVSCQV